MGSLHLWRKKAFKKKLNPKPPNPQTQNPIPLEGFVDEGVRALAQKVWAGEGSKYLYGFLCIQGLRFRG